MNNDLVMNLSFLSLFCRIVVRNIFDLFILANWLIVVTDVWTCCWLLRLAIYFHGLLVLSTVKLFDV